MRIANKKIAARIYGSPPGLMLRPLRLRSVSAVGSEGVIQKDIVHAPSATETVACVL